MAKFNLIERQFEDRGYPVGQHFRQLYKYLDVECECCGRDERFFFESASDPVVCKDCQRHQGDDRPSAQKMREVEHKRLWRGTLDAWHRHYAAETDAADARHALEIKKFEQESARLNGLISDLRGTLVGKLSERPVETVAAWFADTRIAETQNQLQRTRRFIGRLFRPLWALDRLHYAVNTSGDDDVCCCPAGVKCEVLAAIGGLEGQVHEWESKQIDRLREGLEHDLPRDHPEVKKLDPHGYYTGSSSYRYPA